MRGEEGEGGTGELRERDRPLGGELADGDPAVRGPARERRGGKKMLVGKRVVYQQRRNHLLRIPTQQLKIQRKNQKKEEREMVC